MATKTATRGTTSTVPAPRTAPPDRRAPVQIPQGRCPMGSSCGCCPRSSDNNHGRGKHSCPHPHPTADTVCRLPYPAEIPACAERATLAQHTGNLPIACCIECGRVTARRWTGPDNRPVAWCAGTFPTTQATA